MALVLLAAAPLTDADVRAEVDHLVRQVTAVRRLPFRGTLQARPVTRDAADALVAAALAARVTTSNFGVEERIMKRLGLIAGTADYTKLWAAGRRPRRSRPTIPRRSGCWCPISCRSRPARRAPPRIAYAVADQRFDLRRFLAPPASETSAPLDGDATRARLALVEGDATLATLDVVDTDGDFLRPTALVALADRLRAAAGEGRPPSLAALSRFIHVDGFLFVAGVRARQPWSAVDALWRDPPASSEQVLHRAKYDACENPIPVPEAVLPAVAGFDRPKASDVMGELVVRAWLSTALPADVAARAAAGWAGNRAAVYQPPSAEPDGGIAARPTDGVVDDLGRRRRGGGFRARRHDDGRRERHAAGRCGRAVLRRAGAGARRLDGLLDNWKTLSKSARCSPTTRSSARLPTS